MATAASLAGVGDNGLRWKYEYKIKRFIPVVPELDDSLVASSAKAIRKAINKNPNGASLTDSCQTALDEIREYFDDIQDKEELLEGLTQLYDWADYWRVVIK
jgi:hypothetical protein